jgi:hypothetical protein
VETVLAGDLQHVAEAARGDEPHHRAAPLDDGVGDRRGPVRDGGGPLVAEERDQALDDAPGRVGRCRRDLAAAEPPGRLPDDEVRERAADVDADATSRRCWR